MVRLSSEQLNQAFVDALEPPVAASVADLAAPVLELELAAPYPPRLRVYIFNATNPQGGRSTREHKIELIAPGQVKGQRANFDFSGDYAVLLAGKVEDQGAFVLWDASLHRDFAHSSNVQVKTETIETALQSRKIATQQRRLRRSLETVLVTPTAILSQALLERFPAGSRAPLPPPSTAPPPPPVGPATGGKAYVKPPRMPESSEPKARVFAWDPNVVDRGTNAHMDVQDKLAEVVRARGLEPLSPEVGDPDFDVAWINVDVAYVAEVKSLTADNEERQLRLGLGQVLSYVHRLDWDGASEVKGVLAVERGPTASYWVDLCAIHKVILTWPDEFPGVFTDER